MNSSMVVTTHFSLHENVNEKGTSNPPEGIGDALYFNDFRVPKTFLFSFLIKNKHSERFLVEYVPLFSNQRSRNALLL